MGTGQPVIYVLDDDLVELELWQANATKFPVSLSIFSDALKFRLAVIDQPPDIAVIDLVMPFEPGTEVCRWVRECYPEIDVVICTGCDGDQFNVLAQQCGARYMSKQMKHTERLEVLTNVCKP